LSGGHGGDLNCWGIEQRIEHRRVVNGDVENDTRAGGAAESPAAQVGGEGDRVVDPSAEEGADAAVSNELTGGGVEWAAGEVVVDGEDTRRRGPAADPSSQPKRRRP
jgi:hypothetical protein